MAITSESVESLVQYLERLATYAENKSNASFLASVCDDYYEHAVRFRFVASILKFLDARDGAGVSDATSYLNHLGLEAFFPEADGDYNE